MAIRKKPQTAEMPGTLDLIIVDSRWAQVVSKMEHRSELMVKYLDDESFSWLDMRKYKLERKVGMGLGLAMEMGKVSMQDKEKAVVRWGKEQERMKDLVDQVTVFGEYRSKGDIRKARR